MPADGRKRWENRDLWVNKFFFFCEKQLTFLIKHETAFRGNCFRNYWVELKIVSCVENWHKKMKCKKWNIKKECKVYLIENKIKDSPPKKDKNLHN